MGEVDVIVVAREIQTLSLLVGAVTAGSKPKVELTMDQLDAVCQSPELVVTKSPIA
jgi:hypothetical protein